MTILELLEISIDMGNYIKEETELGIEAILDNALSRDEFGDLIVHDEHELKIYSLANVYVDKILILEVATILEKGFNKLITDNKINDGWFRGYQLLATEISRDMTHYLDLIFEINNFIKHGEANGKTVNAIKRLNLNFLLQLGYSDLELCRIFENNLLVTGVDFKGVVTREQIDYSKIKFHNKSIDKHTIYSNEDEIIRFVAELIKLIGNDIITNKGKYKFQLKQRNIEYIDIPIHLN